MKITEKTVDTIIENILGTKRDDYITPVASIRAELIDNSTVGFKSSYSDDSIFDPTKSSFSQINRMLMPGFNQFGQQILSRGMADIYVDAFNRLAEQHTGDCMVRTRSKDASKVVQAFLSSKYNRIDDDAVVSSLIDSIGTKSEFSDKFKSIGGDITDTHTFIKFVSREPAFTIHADGRDRSFSAGLIFSNSETGHGTCQVQVLMIDQYCDNGCIFSSTNIGTFRLVHSGADSSAKDTYGHILPPNVSNAKLEALRIHINGILDAACNPDTFSRYYSMIQNTANMCIDADDEESIGKWMNAIGKYFDITETEKKAVVGRLLDTNDRSLFGIQAALTDAAKYAESYDRKIELERIGGSLLLDAPSRWETIRKLVTE